MNSSGLICRPDQTPCTMTGPCTALVQLDWAPNPHTTPILSHLRIKALGPYTLGSEPCATAAWPGAVHQIRLSSRGVKQWKLNGI